MGGAPGGTADHSFTGDNQDTVSGLYDFTHREHSPVRGRWISPDPASTAAFNLRTPQSLNRYVYVSNNPLNTTDPTGLCDPDFEYCDDPGGGDGGFGGGDGGFGGGGMPGSDGGETNGIPTGLPIHNPGLLGAILPDLPQECDFGPCSTPDFGNGFSDQNVKKLTSKQCRAAQTLLDREDQYGTTVAAWKSAIGYGDGTVQAFNSSEPGLAYTSTARGLVKVDWFTNLRLTTLVPGPQLPAYMIGKVGWTIERMAVHAPITNYLPFQDPVETHTLNLALEGAGFRTLFTPDFMKENCSQ